ncbi:hypothetical protein PO909_028224, partial [Leuciscus waleckii]
MNTDIFFYLKYMICRKTFSQHYCIFLFGLCFSQGSSGVNTDEVSVSVMEGDSVTLNTGVQTNQDDIRWYYNDICIAQINRDLSDICTDVQCNNDTERFRDRLKLDHQTGSLTIRNIRNTDTGVYKLKIFSSSDNEKIFSVNVQAVPGSGLSSGAVAGIVVGVLLVFAG